MIVECPGCKSRYDVTGRSPGTPLRCRCGKRFPIPRADRESSTLGCPNCGASVPWTSERCSYCDATLAVTTCPSCFGRAFLGAKFCPYCAAALDGPARSAEILYEDAPRRCPRCPEIPPSHLLGHLHGDVMLDECSRCGGVYLDARTFDRLVADREKRSAIVAALDPARAAAMPEPMTEQSASVSYLRCPECLNLMNRTNFGRRSGVIVDVCKAHGIWFDKDELRRVLEFVQGGGLEETRRREAEDQRRAAFDRKMERAMHPPSTHGGGSLNAEESMIGEGLELIIDVLSSIWD